MQIQATIQVPSQASIDTSKMNSICKIENGFFHQFATQNVRQLLDICECELLQHISIQGTQVPSYYIKIGSFVQPLEHSIFVQAKFENLITFVFENSQNPNAIYLLSFEVFNPALESFYQALRQATQVVDYKSDSYEKTSIKQRIDLVCGGQLTQDMIENIEYVGPILKTVGSVLGSVSKNVIDPAAKAETIMINGIHMLSEKMVSEENKQRWNGVKETASNWNDKMTEMYKPIDNAFKLITSAISETFNKSENKYVKTLKKFSLATASTLNNSYKKAEQHVIKNNNQNQNPYGLNENHEVSTSNLN